MSGETSILTIMPVDIDFHEQEVRIPVRSVHKRSKLGDYIKVMTGANADETGLVISVSDIIVTFLSDVLTRGT